MTSVSKDGEHSIRSVLNWVQGSNREGWYWRADTDHNTLLSILNTDTNEARVAISLDYYVDGVKHIYVLPERKLASKATSVLDVAAIIKSGLPDAYGEIIPPNVTTGGYHVRKMGLHLDKTLTTEALVVDQRTKSYLTFYNTCCGYTPPVIVIPVSFLGPTGQLGFSSVQGLNYCTNQWDDLTFSSTFSSDNTNVATVNQTTAEVDGVAIGSANILPVLHYPKQKTVDTCIPTIIALRQPANVTPKILRGSTDITNKTTSVSVGEQIALTASSTPLPTGITIQSQSWTVAGTGDSPATAIANFSHTSTNGGPVALTNSDLSQASITYYYVTAATSRQVTLTLTLSDGSTPSAQATFSIAAPTSVAVTVQTGSVAINSGPLLQFGSNSGTNVGIKFTASATPPSGATNNFSWVQLISSWTFQLTDPTNGNQICSCNPPSGLDKQYPASTGPSFNDNPDVHLSGAPSTVSELSNSFSAVMYLMWRPGLPNDISVPLGSIAWGWTGDTVRDSNAQFGWSLNSGAPQPLNPSFAQSSAYPTWSALVPTPGTATCSPTTLDLDLLNLNPKRPRK
jgi:hypothetical protein